MCTEAAESGGHEQEVREGSLGVKHGMVHDKEAEEGWVVEENF